MLLSCAGGGLTVAVAVEAEGEAETETESTQAATRSSAEALADGGEGSGVGAGRGGPGRWRFGLCCQAAPSWSSSSQSSSDRFIEGGVVSRRGSKDRLTSPDFGSRRVLPGPRFRRPGHEPTRPVPDRHTVTKAATRSLRLDSESGAGALASRMHSFCAQSSAASSFGSVSSGLGSCGLARLLLLCWRCEPRLLQVGCIWQICVDDSVIAPSTFLSSTPSPGLNAVVHRILVVVLAAVAGLCATRRRVDKNSATRPRRHE